MQVFVLEQRQYLQLPHRVRQILLINGNTQPRVRVPLLIFPMEAGYSNVTTSVLSVNTAGNFGEGFYRCKINGDLVPAQFTNAKQLTINVVPPPATTPASGCVNTAVTVTSAEDQTDSTDGILMPPAQLK